MDEYFQEGEAEHDRGKHQGQRRQRVEQAASRNSPRDTPARDC